MSYTDRTATTGSPIALTFAKVIDLPPLPQSQFGLTTPIFLAGHTREISLQPDTISSNMPTLWADSYDSSAPAFTGNLVMGVAHADYAIREAGTGASDQNSEYFEKQGYIDHLYVGMNRTLAVAGLDYYDPTVSLEFQRQVLGGFTGGSASVVSASETETQSITFEDYLNNIYTSYIGASLASTTSAPEALFIFNPDYADGPDLTPTTEDQDKIGAFKVGASGAVTLVGLFKTDAGANPEQGAQKTILAQCRDGTHHYFIRGAGFASYTSCLETAWGTFTYSNYTPKFSDPDLPADLETLLSDGDANYRYVSIYGTDVGFLISYKKFNGSTWDPKWVLVDKGWTTVQHIVATAGDATATTVLAQGVGNTSAADINMMMEGGYAWIIGGTPNMPLIVEASGEDISPPVEGNDETTTIRCWPFSLDDHDFGVFRLGPSATLVFDLKSRQWAEWRSPNRTNWRAHIGCNWVGMTETLGSYATDVVCGDDVTGVLYILDPTYGEDDRTDTGSDPFTRMTVGGVQLSGRDTVPCGAVQLTASLGNPALTGGTVTLRTSDDFGHSYVSHGSITISAGSFDQVLEYRSLGLMRAPGRLFEITDDCLERISLADFR